MIESGRNLPAGGRGVYFPEHGFETCLIYEREAHRAGDRIAGPAIIEEHASTLVPPPGDVAAVNATGYIVLRVAGGGASWSPARSQTAARAPGP